MARGGRLGVAAESEARGRDEEAAAVGPEEGRRGRENGRAEPEGVEGVWGGGGEADLGVGAIHSIRI